MRGTSTNFRTASAFRAAKASERAPNVATPSPLACARRSERVARRRAFMTSSSRGLNASSARSSGCIGADFST